MSRRLIKALEDLSVHYDDTVRNASTSIVQFTYGDDGMDPAQMEGKSGFPLNFDRLLSKVKVRLLTALVSHYKVQCSKTASRNSGGRRGMVPRAHHLFFVFPDIY